MIYRIFQLVVQIYLTLVYKVEYRDVENIAQNCPLLVCSNHVSNADPMLVSYRVKKQVHYMGKQELMENFFARMLFKGVGVIPIERGTGDMKSIEKCIDVIRQGKVLGIFPEGGRSKTGELKRFKTGAAYIAREAEADILPACVVIENGKLTRGCKIIIRYGKVIPYEDLGIVKDDPRSLRNAKNHLYETIKELLEGTKV